MHQEEQFTWCRWAEHKVGPGLLHSSCSTSPAWPECASHTYTSEGFQYEAGSKHRQNRQTIIPKSTAGTINRSCKNRTKETMKGNGGKGNAYETKVSGQFNCSPCAWRSCAVSARQRQSFFVQRSWRTGPSSWCIRHCGARPPYCTLHQSAWPAPHAASASHTSPPHYWREGDSCNYRINDTLSCV